MTSESELRYKLINRCHDTSAAAVAREIGVSRVVISDMCRGKRRISNQVAKFLGYRYVPQKVQIERNYEKLRNTER